MDLLDIDAVGGIYVQTGRGLIRVKIAALMDQGEKSGLLALVPRGQENLPKTAHVMSGTDSSLVIGELKELGTKFQGSEYAERIGSLFSVVVFDESFSNRLKKRAKAAPVVRDLESSIFVGGRVRVRRSSSFAKRTSPVRKHNQIKNTPRDRGFISGDISNVTIRTADSLAKIEWAGIVIGRKGHQFAAEGDGGLPVLSRKRALVGFVVGKRNEGTLIIGAEQLAKNLNIRFLAQLA